MALHRTTQKDSNSSDWSAPKVKQGKVEKLRLKNKARTRREEHQEDEGRGK